MTQRTCEVDGCDRKHQARGMCASHWSKWYKATHPERVRKSRDSEKVTRECIQCGGEWRTTRKDAKICSDECRSAWYRSQGVGWRATRCRLPDGHPVMLAIRAERAAEAKLAAERKARRRYEWRTARQCPGCACWFTPIYTPNAITCSRRCARRVHRWRRKAREVGARGDFTYSEFMRIAARFHYRCAYCGGKPEGPLEPDHVVPLSRGGSNSTTNLLPSCHGCNANKRDLLLHEWQAWRDERGLPDVATSWAPGDRRYRHLTDAILISPAA